MTRLLLATATLLFAVATSASAQFTFSALDGLPAAFERAKDSVGIDAEIVFIATTGEIPNSPVPIEFNFSNGRAPAWVYVFRSEQEDRVAAVFVVRVFAYQAFLLPSIPFPIPEVLQSVDTKKEYSDSPKMAGQLRANATFAQYRSDYPDAAPSIVGIGTLLGDNVPVPDGFPVQGSIWTVSFQGQGDSAMTCFVAAISGETFCLRRPATTSVATEAASGAAQLWLR